MRYFDKWTNLNIIQILLRVYFKMFCTVCYAGMLNKFLGNELFTFRKNHAVKKG